LGLTNPRTKILFQDGIEYVSSQKNVYDVVLVDAPDPVGPAKGLFDAPFYRSVHEALKDDGVMAFQGESPVYDRSFIRDIQHTLGRLFSHTGFYLVNIPTYPGGLWSFGIASKGHRPDKPIRTGSEMSQLRYYSEEVHRAAFVL